VTKQVEVIIPETDLLGLSSTSLPKTINANLNFIFIFSQNSIKCSEAVISADRIEQ